MGQIMYSVEEVKELIARGKKLALAGDENLLRQLPPGDWIAGSIPYFMAAEGGLCCRDRIHVTEMPDDAVEVEIRTYDVQTISEVYRNAPENGFSLIIMPHGSPTHLCFALEAPNYQRFAVHPLIGWISGVHLEDLGRRTAKVFCGPGAEALEQEAVVMHVSLPRHKVADIGILNLFEQGEGDTITFPADGFSAKEAFINGEKRDFAEYIREHRLDKRLPLVADYHGAMINTSFQEGEDQEEVRFYAPVFRFLKYKHARPVEDYVGRFNTEMPADVGEQSLFSCNCILNFLYSDLEGKQTGITGPTTFGEIAYQLLNQTLVYLRIIDLSFER